MDSEFRAFWLAPVTRNILGYSMFRDGIQNGFSFRDSFERWNCSGKGSSKYQANTKNETKLDLSVEKNFSLNMQQNDNNDSETLSIATVVAGRGVRSYPPKEKAMSKLFNGKSDINFLTTTYLAWSFFLSYQKIKKIQKGVLQLIIWTFEYKWNDNKRHKER